MWRQYPYIFSTFYRWKKQNKNSRPQGLFDIPLLLAWYLSFALPFLGTSKSTPEMIPIIHLKLVIYDLQLRKERKEFASHHSLRSLGGNLSMEKYSIVSNNCAKPNGVVPFTCWAFKLKLELVIHPYNIKLSFFVSHERNRNLNGYCTVIRYFKVSAKVH